jgi:SAM-dependent methyltransferase
MARATKTKKEHWTHRLFVENAEVYVPFLEDAEDRAGAEVAALATLFQRHGVPSKGRVLDAACGLGRHAVPLALQGYRVVGLDVSPHFLHLARERAAAAGAAVEFVEGDLLQAASVLEGQPPFDAIISMFTSHGYWGRDADVRLFGQLSALAKPGGVLVVSTAHMDWLHEAFRDEVVDIAGPIRLYQRGDLDLQTGFLEGERFYFEGNGDDTRLRLRLDMEHQLYGQAGLAVVLAESGWEAAEWFGSSRGPGMTLGPLTPGSMTMWAVAKAKPRDSLERKRSVQAR